MISANRKQQALHALNGVLIQLRVCAHRGEETKKIAIVLDIAEELPRFLSSEEDQTDNFEKSLEELAMRFPEFGIALNRFLQNEAPESW